MNTNPNQKNPSFNYNTSLSTEIGNVHIITTITTNLTIGNQYYVIESDRIRSRTLAKCQITIDEDSQIQVVAYFQYENRFKQIKTDGQGIDISDVFATLQDAKDHLISLIQSIDI